MKKFDPFENYFPEVLQDLRRIAPCTMSRVDAQAGNQTLRDRLIPKVPEGKKVMCYTIPSKYHDAVHLFRLVEEADQPVVDVTEFVMSLPYWRHRQMLVALQTIFGQ